MAVTKGQRAATGSCNCHRTHRIEVAAAASASKVAAAASASKVAAAASAAAPVATPAAAAVAAAAAPPAEAPGVRHAKGLDVRLRKSSECLSSSINRCCAVKRLSIVIVHMCRRPDVLIPSSPTTRVEVSSCIGCVGMKTKMRPPCFFWPPQQ